MAIGGALVLCLAPYLVAQAAGNAVHGRQVFATANCSMCHVGGGNMICPDKPLKGAGFLKRYPSDAMIAAVIRNGVPGTVMDRFGKDKISDADLQDIVAYIRSLTPAGAAKTPSVNKTQAAAKHK